MLEKLLKLILTILCIVAVALGIYYAIEGKMPDIKLAFAAEETTQYSSVLEDLQKDEKFDASNYPAIADNYTVQLVQVAESAAGELFVYTYEPSGNAAAHASSINISTAINESLSYKNYKLEFLNNSGTISKYLAKDFVLKQDTLRYYDISNIYRAWSAELGDEPNENGNIITEVPYAVGQLWTATTINGNVSYKCTTTELIEVTNKYVGYVRYTSSSTWCVYANYDSHFIAFETSHNIDNLLQADVYFTRQNMAGAARAGASALYSTKTEDYAYLADSDCFSFTTHNWGKDHDYNKDRIVSASEFMENENFSNVYSCGLFNVSTQTKITETGKSTLSSMQWVLRFYESEAGDWRSFNNKADFESLIKGHTPENYIGGQGRTIVGDVSILRLKFDSNGEIYNIGVVDNKQSELPDQDPDNETEIKYEVPEWLKAIFEWLQNAWAKFKVYIIIGLVIILLSSILSILKTLFGSSKKY